MPGPPNDRFDQARRRAGLTLSELWVQYFSAGGDHGAIELDAVLNGALAATRDEHDLIAQVLNERFMQLGAGTRLSYTDEAVAGAATAGYRPMPEFPAPRSVPAGHPAASAQTAERVVATVHLEPDALAPRSARRWARELLDHLGQPGLIDLTASGLSELVTNVCVHARTPMTVTMSAGLDRTLRFGVRDYSATLPVRRDAANDATTGRGLQLVAACGEWGVDEHPDGKTVWFEPHDRTGAKG